jgi:hypothetical protein
VAIGSVLREPLVHFVVLGFALFYAGRHYQGQASVYRIMETPARVAYLAQQYALQFGRRPDERMLQILVRRDIQDEMLLRQGLALGLDRGDEIVRRRIVQKMQFLLTDTSAPPEPTEQQLRTYYATHEVAYRQPARVTFSHVYFADEPGRFRLPAEQRARDLLGILQAPDIRRAPERGDSFPDRYDFADYDAGQVRRLFGDSELAREVFVAPVGRWSGPYRSGYGWHLVYVNAQYANSVEAFESVKDRVRTDYLQGEQAKANDAALVRLARRFTVIRPDSRDAL